MLYVLFASNSDCFQLLLVPQFFLSTDSSARMLMPPCVHATAALPLLPDLIGLTYQVQGWGIPADTSNLMISFGVIVYGVALTDTCQDIK